MDLQTGISRVESATVGLQLYRAGRHTWLAALLGVLAVLMLLAVFAPSARAQEEPEVFAGDGCARAGEVEAGNCDEDSGKADDDNRDANKDASGGNTEMPKEVSEKPRDAGGGTTTGEGLGDSEDTSGANGATGSSEPNETTGDTTVAGTTGPGFAKTTGFEETGSTVGGEPEACPAGLPEDAPAATVARAIDGDTVELQEPVNGYDRVRLIGVNTPEMDGEDGTPEDGAKEATAFTAEALEGEGVTLETDEEVEDPYGRLLAYVWLPEDNKAEADANAQRPEFFNHTLITDGYAETMTIEPNDAYAECLAATENEPKNGTTNTTGGTTGGKGNKDEKPGLLDRLRNLVSSEDPSGGQTTNNDDQYGQGGTTHGAAGGMTNGATGGSMPAKTVPEEGFKGDTLQEDTAPGPMTGGEKTYEGTSKEDAAKNDGAARDRTFQEDSTPPEMGGTDGSMELREPDTQQPEAQEPEVQDPPARNGELGTGSELADPDDPSSEELAVPQTPTPAPTDTELDTGTDTPTDTGSVADQAQLTTLPETSGVPLIRLAALPAGVALICSGLLAALIRGPKPEHDNSGR